MGVGAVPEEGKESHQFTADIDKDGIHTCEEDWVESGEGDLVSE